MLVLLALLPFAAMCVNAIVCALGIVDSVGSFTLCRNEHKCDWLQMLIRWVKRFRWGFIDIFLGIHCTITFWSLFSTNSLKKDGHLRLANTRFHEQINWKPLLAFPSHFCYKANIPKNEINIGKNSMFRFIKFSLKSNSKIRFSIFFFTYQLLSMLWWIRDDELHLWFTTASLFVRSFFFF